MERIDHRSWLGKLIRLPLRAIPRGATLPILWGPLRGSRWTAGVASHSCWLGTYERQTQRRLRPLLRRGATAYDIGANAGFFTLFAARCVGPTGSVVAFEPNARNVAALRRHIALNALDNVDVVEAAVSAANGVAEFSIEGALEQGRLASLASSPNQIVRVATVSLDSLVSSGKAPPPDAMKIDVEGAELLVLQGAREVLREYRPDILLELHNREMDRLCPEYLGEFGYIVRPYDTWPGTTIARGGLVATHPTAPAHGRRAG